LIWWSKTSSTLINGSLIPTTIFGLRQVRGRMDLMSYMTTPDRGTTSTPRGSLNVTLAIAAEARNFYDQSAKLSLLQSRQSGRSCCAEIMASEA
jgi:hypothetical protein